MRPGTGRPGPDYRLERETRLLVGQHGYAEPEVRHLLLDSGADVNLPGPTGDDWDATPLQHAILARQPAAAARIQTVMIIGLALIESLALYVFVIAAILLFVQPVK